MKNKRFQQTISILTLLAVFFGSSVLVKALPGDPDEIYGTTGFYIDNQPNTGDNESTAFFDGELTADGKLISVGTFTYFIPTQNFGYTTDFYIQRILPNGQRDPSFGNIGAGNGNAPGSVRLNNLFPLGTEAVARAVKIQQDNKIVIAGVCNIIVGVGTQDVRQSGFGMCAARLNPNGALDTSFGGNNFIVQHSPSNPSYNFNYTMPAGTTFVHYPNQFESGYAGRFNSNNAGALDVAIHSDGRIVLAGYGAQREFGANNAFLGYNHVAAVVTLAPNGGFSSVHIAPGDQTASVDARRTRGRAFYQVETQSDGNFVAVGNNLHLNNDGFIDGNRWILTNGTASWTSENFSNRGLALSLKLTRGNKILVGGWAKQTGDIGYVGALMRFNSNLTPDTTFGSNGRVTYCRGEVPCQILPFTITVKLASVQNDGKILATLSTRGNPYSFPGSPEGGEALVRFNPDGSIDRSFGNAFGNNANNVESYGFSFLRRDDGQGGFLSLQESPFAVLQTDGKIVAGGIFAVNGYQNGRAGTTRRQNTFVSAKGGILSDFNNDGRADISVYRAGVWHQLNSLNNSYSAAQFGISGDRLAPADYDGDGRTDLAVFRNGTWYIYQSSNNQVRVLQWGVAGDLPRPGDFNGDGQADIAVFRPSNGTWYVFYSNPIQPGNVTHSIVQFGSSGDIPMLGDYDADGKTDFAVFRPSNSVWYILRSSDNKVQIDSFGTTGDIPLNGDFNGDSKADLAVFRPSNRTWYIARPTGVPAQNFDAFQFGVSTDIPVPADYDNDGKTDVAVYRSGTWYILQSGNNSTVITQFGLANDTPVPAAYLP